MLTCLIIGLICYALACLSGICLLLSKKEFFGKAALASVLAGFLVLTCILYFVLLATPFARENYLFIFAWLFSAICIYFWRKLKNSFLLLASSPLFFLLLHTAMLTNAKAGAVSEAFTGVFFYTHIGALFFSIILLFIGGIAACLFLLQESAMKHKNQLSIHFSLPSLEALDKVNFIATVWGFPFYTLGLICGFVWASTVWEGIFTGDIKEIISLLVWLCYAGLFHIRLALGLRGKKPAFFMLFLCVLSLFSLLVVNTLFPTHHNFWDK